MLLGLLASAPVFADATVLEVFVRDGCPHCSAAKAYLTELSTQHPELEIRLREVDRDPAARADLLRLSREAGAWPPAVPTFVIGDQLLVGFDDATHSGARLLALIEQRVQRPGTVESTLFGTLSLERLGLPAFTLALGLLDGFNPCAMWVLLFLLSLLVRLQDRRRMAAIAGTFVLISGAVYYLLSHPELNGSVSLNSAVDHYLTTGAAQGFKPNNWFDPSYYENRWNDLKNANLDDATLFLHYNLYGVWEGRSAGPKFDQYDGERYLQNNPDVAAYVDANVGDFLGSRTNGAIAHYIIYGANEGRLAYDLSNNIISSATLIGIAP